MRGRSAVVLAGLLAGCLSNPDPRARKPESVGGDAFGGWIVVEHATGMVTQGELIDVEPEGLRVLVRGAVVWEPRAAVTEAKLYGYHPDLNGFVGWSFAGGISTISNGFFLVFTLPAWLITTTLASRSELHAAMVQFPDDKWEDLATWARFPQGLPPSASDADVVRQLRVAPAPPPVVPVPAGPGSGLAPSGPPSATPVSAPPSPASSSAPSTAPGASPSGGQP